MKSAHKETYHSGNGFVLIPAFNESGMIARVIRQVGEHGFRVIVVDDGSTDDTAAIARANGAIVLSHLLNLGQGAALETGMTYLRTISSEWVIHFDADGQHDAHHISRMLAALNEADVVLGSRFLAGAETPGMSIGRKRLLVLARIFQNLLTGVRLTDAHCGFRALNRKALNLIRLRESGMAHATEIIVEIRRHDLKVKEVPVRIAYSDYSKAKGQSAFNAFQIIATLIQRKIL